MPAFDIGTVFSRFFRLVGENFAVIAALGLIGVVLPSVVVAYGVTSMLGGLIGAPNPTDAYLGLLSGTNLGISFGSGLLLFVLNLIILSMITEVTILRAIGKPMDIGAIFSHALRNILPLLVISILVAIMIFFGFLAFIIPGIFLALATCVAVPVYVGEPARGITGSISRSFELTKGRRWWLLLIFIVLGIGAMAIGGTISSMTMPFMFTPGTTPDPANMGATMMPYMLVNAAVDGVVRVLGTVLVAAIYVCLRETREKLTPETTAEVFN